MPDSSNTYLLGLDFGTNSMRALVVRAADGAEIGTGVVNYPSGGTGPNQGVITDHANPDLARQNPLDYLHTIEAGVKLALAEAAKTKGFSPASIVGIGVDTTGSSPMPVDKNLHSLNSLPGLNIPDACVWLWKDHTGHAEAAELTAAAAKSRPQYLAKCGEKYSSEWFWSKILKCSRVNPKVADAAHTWVEIADWIPAQLAGITDPAHLKRGICAAGHKAFFNPNWGGYADADFLGSVSPYLAKVRATLPDKTYSVAEEAGKLSSEWAAKLGLTPGLPIAVGAFDAHLGAVGAGITEGTLVKIMGTSTCDIMISTMSKPIADIPGLCGIVPESVLPHFYGLEAGQSAVGDIFNWVTTLTGKSHDELTAGAAKLRPGESGLLALDWHNGNRTVLIDQRLTGNLVGLTLHSTPAEIYRAMIEATAFGSRVIMERLEEGGAKVTRVVNCGGISARSPLAMQIYADIMNRPIQISSSLQTCALGSALAASVVAKVHPSFEAAVKTMTAVQEKIFTPDPNAAATYEKLYHLYKQLHDAFGPPHTTKTINLTNVMKDLLNLRDAIRAH
jgi:L-ribulokinase